MTWLDVDGVHQDNVLEAVGTPADLYPLVIDTIETFRDMVTGMLDIYLSSISNRMNEVK